MAEDYIILADFGNGQGYTGIWQPFSIWLPDDTKEIIKEIMKYTHRAME